MKVVLLPGPTFGHLMPFYHLARALGKAGVNVHYIATSRNIDRLPKLPSYSSTHVNFVKFPMPTLPENPLPEGAEASSDIPNERNNDLIKAYDLLKEPVKEFVMDNSPDWLIVDMHPYWAVQVAQECSVPLMFFQTFSAATSFFCTSLLNTIRSCDNKNYSLELEDLISPPRHVTFPSRVAFRLYDVVAALPRWATITDHVAMSSIFAMRAVKILDHCDIVAIRSCHEIEGDYLGSLAKMFSGSKQVVPIGFLAPEKPHELEVTTTTQSSSEDNIFGWLDDQKPKSVVFIAFGSEYVPKDKEIHEIARGLEESEQPFLFVLRKHSWENSLPPGYIDRTANQGRVWFGWSPQLRILAHCGIGGYLCHCGWSSMIEALFFGHSLVVLPFVNDETLNASLMVEKGLAIEVDRNEVDGSFSGENIAKCLRQAMGSGEKSVLLRDRVKEASVVAGDMELQDRYIEELVTFLHQKDTKKTQTTEGSSTQGWQFGP